MKIKQQDPSKVIIIPRPPQAMASQMNPKEVKGEILSDPEDEQAEEEVETGHQTAKEESKDKVDSKRD